MSRIEIQISASRPIFIEADADAFGQVFAGMNSDEQVAVFRAMVEHMKPHRIQWDYIAIELEQEENREVRREIHEVLFPADKHRALIETLVKALEALQRQALQSDLNSPSHEWGWEALGMTKAALDAAKHEGF